ncbi:acyl-CoA dehydrogenase family protein [Ureibacillus thermophilus]|uniref:acyl-CoA dehydrogenase family protein n=1 Tax=Ureibacillus thermophilus TaxID=367743 RepID=UPI00361EF7FC
MSEMKEMILDAAGRMLKENISKDVVDLLERDDWARGIWALFEETGMLNVAISEKHGGAGGDLEDLLHIVRLTGKYAAPMPYAESTFANFLLEATNQAIVKKITTYSLKEGFHLQNDLISGSLHNVRWARHADYLVALVNSFQGTQIALIDLQKATIEHSNNLASEPRDTIILDKVKPISIAPLSEEQLFYTLSIETAFKIALMTGAIERIYEITVQYSKKREQFGRPIHRFQLVQQHLAQLAGETAIAITAFHNVCAAIQSKDFLHEIAFARIRIEDAITTITSVAHQIHAAIGMTHEYTLHQYTRRLWSWRDEGRNSPFWSNYIADYLLKHDVDLWAYLTKTIGKK